MPEIWAVNASPVITLAKAGHVGLTEAGWGQRIATVEVPSEVLE